MWFGDAEKVMERRKTAEAQVSWGKEKASEQPKDSKEHSVNAAREWGPSRRPAGVCGSGFLFIPSLHRETMAV